MSELFDIIKTWFLGLGQQYGVNPIIFGSIYVGAIPFFTISITWLIRNYKREKSIIAPAFCASFFFISAYLYLIIVGHDVPWWIYGIIVLMLGYGAWSTFKKIRSRMNKIDNKIYTDE